MRVPGRKDRVPRAQIHPRLPADITKRIRVFAASKGSSQSSVIEAALATYLDDSGERAVILRRLDRLAHAVRKVDRDVAIVADAFSIFVEIWLSHTNRIPDHERIKAEQTAQKRFLHFRELLSGRLATGRSFIADLVRDGRAVNNDGEESRPASGDT